MQKNLKGIYIITNKLNNLSYIGSSIKCIKTRISYHLKDLRANKHHSSKLQNSYNKYGEKQFSFEVVEIIENVEDIINREQFYLDSLLPFFNICPTAGNCKGRKFSEESKLKMSESAKARGLNSALLKQQEPKYIETENEKYCSKCQVYHNKDKFNKRIGNICKEWTNSNRESRAVPGLRKASDLRKAKPIITKQNNEMKEFESMRECVRQLSTLYPKINRFGIKLAIKNNKTYYGYNWSYKCPS